MKTQKLVKKTVTLLVCLAFILPTVLQTWASGQTTDTTVLASTEISVVEAIDQDFILEHIEYVTSNIGPRLAGTPAEERSGDYFAGVFEELGLEPYSYATAPDGTDDYFQTVENQERVMQIIGGSLTINGREYAATAPNWSDESVYKGYNSPQVTGDTIYFETVDEAIAADDAEIKDHIVLTNRKTDGTFADEARQLEAKGAKAVVFFYNKYTVNANGKVSAESRFSAPTSGEEINIPVVLSSYLDGQNILSSLTHHDTVDSVEATVVNRRNTTTRNVLAIKEAVQPTDQYVLIGAHYDSVFGAEGVNDNLSGAVNVLAIANALKDVPTQYNIVFALWGAEELGLRGSNYFYNNTLAPDDYWENFIAYYNLDMAATSQKANSVLTIHTPYRNSDQSPYQSLAGEVFEEQAERYWEYSEGQWGDWWTLGSDDTVDIAYYGSCSDHASITGATSGVAAGEGIPAVYAFWGGPNVTEYNYHCVGDRYIWTGDLYDEFYLKGEDTYYSGNFSIERAQILATVFALSVYNTAALPISDISDGETYYGDTTFSVSYEYIDSVTVDGQPVELTDGAYTIPADNAQHTITAADRFGNTTVYTIGVYKTYTVTFIADDEIVAERTVGHGTTLLDIPDVPVKTGYDKTPAVWSGAELENITSNRTLYAKYIINQYTVTVPTGDGFTVRYEGGNTVDYNGSFSFSVEISDKFYKTDAFAVTVDDVVVKPDKAGKYHIEAITSDKTIAVAGIEAVKPSDPEGSGNNSSLVSSQNNSGTASPKTGDAGIVAVWLVLAFVSSGITIVSLKRKK